MDDAVRDSIDAIAPEHRPLFDRLHRLVLEAHPDAAVVLSYQIPPTRLAAACSSACGSTACVDLRLAAGHPGHRPPLEVAVHPVREAGRLPDADLGV